MSDLKEDAIRHKYAPLPENGPRHRKKSRKRHVKSDHRHVYEEVAIDAHSYVVSGGTRMPCLHHAKRCRVCGRICNVTIRLREVEPPDGMPLYEVDDYLEFATMDALPERYRVR